MKISIFTLHHIEFIDNEDQTIAFNKRVHDWMTQWTVDVNFKSLANLDGNAEAASNEWQEDFERAIHNAIGDVIKGYDYQDDFVFHYSKIDVEENEPYWRNGLACRYSRTLRQLKAEAEACA